MNKDDKSYCFAFPGSRTELAELFLRESGGRKAWYLEDYLLRMTDDGFEFGVERAGHSDGWWYLPEMREKDGTLIFTGQIKFRGASAKEPYEPTFADKVGEVCLGIFAFTVFLPVTLPFVLYERIKQSRQGGGRVLTTEERLYDLMVNCLHCTPCDDPAL